MLAPPPTHRKPGTCLAGRKRLLPASLVKAGGAAQPQPLPGKIIVSAHTVNYRITDIREQYFPGLVQIWTSLILICLYILH
jgi:hypothetical protein